MLVLAVHGSADPAAAAVIGRLVRTLRTTGGTPVLVGHLDVQRPSLAEVVRARPGAVVVPLLLGDGYHRTVDIPAVLDGTGCALTAGLSGEPDIAAALYGRLRAAERAADPSARADAVLVAGAGSSRPGGNTGTEDAATRLAALLAASAGGPGTAPVPVRTAYLTSAAPTVPEALAELRAAGHRRIAVAAHLLAPGRFTRFLADAGAWTVTEPLADHPRVARLVLARHRAAEDARAAADTRAALPGTRTAC
ncbi:CbiX/SirB N-terminal domain-containing protein [Streptomyces sp. NPDC097619]|uniref:sirohydrochlorin chelatase n=1 Tax=Streptomyces sp. NPDC097619 TaxID=3157228 RepID=UPI0033275B98